jgi:transcriptional regulator GlxA family with amidase domain
MTLKLRDDRVRWREIDDDVVAVDIDRSTYLGTNASGALLWLELVGGTTRERLVERLAQAYLIDDERAEADVDSFLSTLNGQGLLEEE